MQITNTQKEFGKTLRKKNLRKCHDLYVFEAIQYCQPMYLKICEIRVFQGIHKLDPLRFRTAPGLARQAALKSTEVKLELLMVEKGIRGGICHAIHRYVKVNNKCMKDYDKKKEVLGRNNLYRQTMSQKLPVDGIAWVINKSKFNEDFIKIQMFNILKNYMSFTMIYNFYQKE